MTVFTAPSRIAYDIGFWLIVTFFFAARFYFLRFVQPKHRNHGPNGHHNHNHSQHQNSEHHNGYPYPPPQNHTNTNAGLNFTDRNTSSDTSSTTSHGQTNGQHKKYQTLSAVAGDFAICLSYLLISADLAGDVYLQARKIGYGWRNGERRGGEGKLVEVEWVEGLDIPRALMDYNLKFWFATPFMWMTAMWCIKLAFLSLYYDIGTRQQLSRTISRLMYAGVGFTLATWPVVIVTYALWCGTTLEGLSRNWKATPSGTAFCHASISSKFSAIKTSLHIFTDIIIFTLPILLLRQAATRQHRVDDRHICGICFIFCLGFSTIIVSMVRYIETAKVQAAGTDMTEIGIPESVEMIWLMVVVEYAVAMVAVCLPSMRSLLRVRTGERRARARQAAMDMRIHVHDSDQDEGMGRRDGDAVRLQGMKITGGGDGARGRDREGVVGLQSPREIHYNLNNLRFCEEGRSGVGGEGEGDGGRGMIPRSGSSSLRVHHYMREWDRKYSRDTSTMSGSFRSIDMEKAVVRSASPLESMHYAIT
ncbi:hypothetical protein DFH27DRAFT_611697 [Peziza echinospora]|nr:hypothetical protein DFH27DRAFT_611697 [Peziza echinospora]